MNAIAVFDNQPIQGKVFFTQTNSQSPVILQFQLSGFHHISAIHIHEYGDLSEGCKSLGGHFNPTNKLHGHHAGDIVFNAIPNKKGEYIYTYKTKELSLYPGKKNIIGRSLVIHNYIDDYGKQGRFIEKDDFQLYQEMTYENIVLFTKMSGYPLKSKKEMISKLMSSSLETGNAGERLACAIIGLRPSNPKLSRGCA